MSANDALRRLPSIDLLLSHDAWEAASEVPHGIRRAACREVVDRAREALLAGEPDEPDAGAMALQAVDAARARVRPVLRPVINATGVILHTNLGRAPLPRAALDAIAASAGRYTNLEMSLESGRRDDRQGKLADAFARVIGAEDVVVVNNNAAAVFLALRALAGDGGEVAVSRGEQVEIGGSFRIPDILRAAGARLVEVGTTNRTHPRDYQAALDDGATMLLKVHRSNFDIVGFTRSVSCAELVGMARPAGALVVHDLGSGLLWGDAGERESTVRRSLEAGVDLVCFSGDKLLGGPQCGIAAGRAAVVERLRKHPVMRMLRPGKLQLLALEATLLAWERDPTGGEIPAARALRRTSGELRRVAEALVGRARAESTSGLRFDVVAADSTPGGGASPTVLLPSWAVAVIGGSPDRLAAALRRGDPPIVGRVDEGRLLLDVRTLLPGDDDAVGAALASLSL